MLLVVAVSLMQAKFKPQLVHSEKIGAYRLEKWSFPGNGDDHYEDDDDDLQAVRLVDGHGRLVTEVHDYKVEFDDSYKDVNHDGVRDVIIRSRILSGHPGSRLFIWSLGTTPRCLIAYEKYIGEGAEDIELNDLDGDGIPEVDSWYDGFYYRDVAGDQPSFRAGPVPIVLRYERGRFIDRTTAFPERIRSARSRAWENFNYDQERPWAYYGPQRQDAVLLVALGYVSGNVKSVFAKLRPLMTPADFRWLWQSRWIIRQIVADRYRCYSYPSFGAIFPPPGRKIQKSLPPIRVPSS